MVEIQGQAIHTNTNSNGSSQPLREGEVHRAKIESRISSNEAVISIRGQEVKARFTDSIPPGERVTVQIEGKTETGVRVSALSDEKQRQATSQSSSTSSSNQLDKVLHKLGQGDATPELKNAVTKFLDRGVPLTKETIQQLNQYIVQGRSNIQQRTETIDIVSKKGLEPSTENLRSIHEALHGQKFSEQIEAISKQASSRREFSTTTHVESRSISNNDMIAALQKVRNSLSNNKELRQSITEVQRILTTGKHNDSKAAVLQTLREVLQFQGKQQTHEAVNKLQQLMQQLSHQKEQARHSVSINDNSSTKSIVLEWQSIIESQANLQQAIEMISDALAKHPLPSNVEQIVAEGLMEATNRLDQGRELKARQTLMEVMQSAQENINSATTGQQIAVTEPSHELLQYITNEILQRENITSKDILITQVTERLAQVTDEFKGFQRDVSHQLARINMMIQQFKAQSIEQTKPMLDKVIKQLDNALLKSDWLLFADMKTEKTVLEASGRLAEAKKHLARGDYIQARQVVREVQSTLDKLMFKPENQKVQHYITNEQQWREAKPETHRLSQQYEQITKSLTQNNGSPREVFEGIRNLGLNRESELAQILANKGPIRDEQQRDMKSLLLQMSRGEEEGSKLQQQAQQSVQHLAGQQLMGRVDHQQNMQMLMFQLPILLKGAAEQLQVFVNARNEGEKLDWENCSLYFLMETKKMGEVGIAINVTDRALSLTLKNDQPSFQQKIEPIAGKYLDRLKEVGFNVNGLKFSKITPDEVVKKDKDNDQQEQMVPTMTKKGFDYKI